jgi:small-conductance mechanosensitive channel
MQFLNSLLNASEGLIPFGITSIVVLVVLVSAHYFLNWKFGRTLGFRFRIQLFMLIISFLGLVAILLALPLSEGTKGQLLGLIGILLSGVIALSATTFVGNIMAGLMMRAMRNIRPGDFIRVGEHFGRVSELELFHVELQTESRDLTTLPNLFMATKPVKVIRSSGTLVTTELSLGYEIPHRKVISLLKQAALEADLKEPFVHVVDLGNFAITYRVLGLLTDVKNLLTTHSRLKRKILNQLHEAGIEIVSPNFMNQRQLSPDQPIIPEVEPGETEVEAAANIEAIAFDKADKAESIEKLRKRHQDLKESLTELQERAGVTEDKEEQAALEVRARNTTEQMERLAQYIAEREERIDD